MTARLFLAQTHLGAWLGLKQSTPFDPKQIGASGCKTPGNLMTHSKKAVEHCELCRIGFSPS